MSNPAAGAPAAAAGPPNPQQIAAFQQAQMAYMQQLQRAQMARPPMFPGLGMPPPFPGMGMPFPGMPPMGGMPDPFAAGFGKGKGKSKGKGKGKGKFKGKGKGKGDEADGDGEERPPREENPVVVAQRNARQRFEKDILDRIQGRWMDKEDPPGTYVVDGNIAEVKDGKGGRSFHNRLSAYGVDFCWSAGRVWYELELKELYSAGEKPEEIKWKVGRDSAEAEPVVWIRDTRPIPDPEPAAEAADAAGDAAAEAPAEAA